MNGHEYLAMTGELERMKLRFSSETLRLQQLADLLDALAEMKQAHKVVINANGRLADHLYYAGAVTSKEQAELKTAHRVTQRRIEQLEAHLLTPSNPPTSSSP
jgi:hypothetical protein